MRPFKQLLLVLLGFASFSQAEPLGSAITYQGELRQSGQPANGFFDFEVGLYFVASGGVPVDVLTLNDVLVDEGIFTLQLDFTSIPFTGEQPWLGIAVREGASIGGYTGLLPRQKLTAVPYALNAIAVSMDSIDSDAIADGQVSSVDVADNSLTAQDLANNSVGAPELADNSVGAAELDNNSVDSAAIVDGAVTGSKIASGAVGAIQANTQQLQARLSGVCAEGTFLRGINEDGTIVCGAPLRVTPYLLGISGIQSDGEGRASFGGLFGMAAVNASCAADYPSNPGAHFCTPDELQRAVGAGSFPADTSSFDEVETHIVGAIFTDSQMGAAPPDQSLLSTCQNMVGETGDVGRGATATVDIDYMAVGNGGGEIGNIVNFKTGVDCQIVRPFLCCQ